MSGPPVLFTPCKINGMKTSCRIMRSATFEALGTPEGLATKSLTNLFVKYSRGKCGLIVTGCTYTELSGRTHLKQVILSTPAQIDSFAQLTSAVHKAHGLLAVQINHGGPDRYPHKPLGSIDAPISPSTTDVSRAARVSEIDHIVESMAHSARAAYQIGVDAVQIHAAHSSLPAQFLSPLSNHRTDEFGGDVAHRFEFLRRVLVRIRQEVPKSYPILIKMNGSDKEIDGLKIEDAVQIAKLAEKAGADALEISSGVGGKRPPWYIQGNVDFSVYDEETRKKMQEKLKGFHFVPRFNEDLAAEIKKNVKIPVISVGGYRKFSEMNNAILEGKCDMVSLSRPFIREPGFVAEMMKDHNHVSTCKSCNRCIMNTSKNENPLRCMQPY